MDRLPISGNVPAEIAERLSDVSDRIENAPYFADEEDYEGVVQKSLHAPLAQLFSTRNQIRMVQRIEGLNHAKAIEWLLRDLEELERALKQIWEAA